MHGVKRTLSRILDNLLSLFLITEKALEFPCLRAVLAATFLTCAECFEKGQARLPNGNVLVMCSSLYGRIPLNVRISTIGGRIK